MTGVGDEVERRSLRRSRVQGLAKQFLLELDVEVAGADGAGVGDERDEGLGQEAGGRAR